MSINPACAQFFCRLKKMFSSAIPVSVLHFPVNLKHIFSFTYCSSLKKILFNLDLPAIKLDENEDVTEEAVATTLKRAISRFSTLQAHDGHWPGDYGGPMFLIPGLVLP